jgi:hypothetical protein
MTFTVEIPDSFARPLHLDGPQPDRRALEVFALEAYRAGELSRGQVSELLGIGFHETEQFLKAHNAGIGLTLDEFHEDAERLEKLLAR